MSSLRASASVTLSDCRKTFPDGVRALGPVNLQVAAGETLVLLGPSGCGKTTTLRLIAGLEQPDAGGRVLFDDRDVTELPIEKRDIGMVFQSYALFPNMNVAGNIGYGLRLRRRPAAEITRRVGEMMSMMRIDDLASRTIDQLSGGQRQRVALARALAVEPRALLLDEPLTALDAQLREDLRVEINRLLRSLGVTTIYVTHDQAEAMALGDRVAVMRGGVIEQIGTPRDIYRRPATPFVADFIGDMNRMRGHMSGDTFITSAGTIPSVTAPATTTCIRFRPEAARLNRISPQIRGTLAAIVFRGASSRLFVDVGDIKPLIIDTAETLEFCIGEQIGMSIDPDGILTLDEAEPC